MKLFCLLFSLSLRFCSVHKETNKYLHSQFIFFLSLSLKVALTLYTEWILGKREQNRCQRLGACKRSLISSTKWHSWWNKRGLDEQWQKEGETFLEVDAGVQACHVGRLRADHVKEVSGKPQHLLLTFRGGVKRYKKGSFNSWSCLQNHFLRINLGLGVWVSTVLVAGDTWKRLRGEEKKDCVTKLRTLWIGYFLGFLKFFKISTGSGSPDRVCCWKFRWWGHMAQYIPTYWIHSVQSHRRKCAKTVPCMTFSIPSMLAICGILNNFDCS